MAAALLGPFKACKGIEILENLHVHALEIKEKYDTYASQQEGPMPQVELIKGSIFEVDWTDASFIFANSTCFDYDLITKISKTPCRKGTFAMSLTRPLLTAHWQILESVKKHMSWGDATLYIQVKVDEEEMRCAQEEFARALDAD